MNRFKMNLKGFRKDRRGASLVEYSLLLGLMAMLVVTTITSVGTDLGTIWTATKTKTGTAATNANK